MSVRLAKQTQIIFAPVSVVWEHLYEVSHWNLWMPQVERVELLETPKTDARGRVFKTKGQQSFFRMVDVKKLERLSWESPYRLGTQLLQSCSVIRNAEGAVLSLELSCEGTFEKQVQFFVRKTLEKQLLEQSLRLKELSEKKIEGVVRVLRVGA